MTVGATARDVLAQATVLFVPIFNVDGHERFSAFTRVNQRGPEEGGWRTTGANLNLNRDYAKADTPEMRAMLRDNGPPPTGASRCASSSSLNHAVS